MDGDGAKQQWTAASLQEFIDAGEVLVFANKKARVEALVQQFEGLGVRVAGMHGDMDQVITFKQHC